MPKLREIMTPAVFTTHPDTPLIEVAQRMVQGRFGSALVLQGSWLVGIFTERDIVRAAASGFDPKTAIISEWMTKDPITASPDMESEDAAQIMVENGFRHLPVVEGREVAGIVSLRDIFAARIKRPS